MRPQPGVFLLLEIFAFATGYNPRNFSLEFSWNLMNFFVM